MAEWKLITGQANDLDILSGVLHYTFENNEKLTK